MREREANRPLATVVTEKPRFRADVAIFAIGLLQTDTPQNRYFFWRSFKFGSVQFKGY